MATAEKREDPISSVHPIPRPDTLTHLAYERIKGLMVAGRLDIQKIYPASQFADILGVSRTPVREALLQLAAEGYLNFAKGRGFSIRVHTAEEVREFFEVRRLVECYVVGRLIDTLRQKDVAQLERILEKMSETESEDTDLFLKYDSDFHLCLLERLGNRFLVSVMENVRGLLSILGLKALAATGRGVTVIQEHKKIVDAIKRKDKEAAVKAMVEHLDSTERHLIQRIGYL
jgi:DNA-binding GntR family transcriptional regulator